MLRLPTLSGQGLVRAGTGSSAAYKANSPHQAPLADPGVTKEATIGRWTFTAFLRKRRTGKRYSGKSLMPVEYLTGVNGVRRPGKGRSTCPSDTGPAFHRRARSAIVRACVQGYPVLPQLAMAVVHRAAMPDAGAATVAELVRDPDHGDAALWLAGARGVDHARPAGHGSR